jgi:sugar lactone lactonase YvrE
MADHELRPLIADAGVLFEGPRWRDGVWWVSDIFGRQVSTVSPDGVLTPVLALPERPSGLGWLPDGSLLVVSQLDSRILRRHESGEVTVHADLAHVAGGARGLLNDMVVDEDGRAWVGEFGFDYDVRPPTFAPANVYRVESDGSVHVAADDLAFPNGMVLSVDSSELIVGETFGGRYSAYPIGADGQLGPRRTWAQLGDSPPPGPLPEMREALTFTPDGCCLDADGRIWSADPKGRRLVLLEEGGRVVEEVPAPDGRAFIACMLGGERGRTLLASVVPSPHDYVSRHAALFTIEVDVPHGGRP